MTVPFWPDLPRGVWLAVAASALPWLIVFAALAVARLRRRARDIGGRV